MLINIRLCQGQEKTTQKHLTRSTFIFLGSNTYTARTKCVRISSTFHLYIAKQKGECRNEINRYCTPTQMGRMVGYVATYHRAYVVFDVLVCPRRPLLPRFYIGYLLLCPYNYTIYDYSWFCWNTVDVLSWLFANR